jgi:hypothetical protein
MSDDASQCSIYREEVGRFNSDLSSACAVQGSEYGFSYYWWYYSIPTSNCHALGKST